MCTLKLVIRHSKKIKVLNIKKNLEELRLRIPLLSCVKLYNLYVLRAKRVASLLLTLSSSDVPSMDIKDGKKS